MPNFSVLFYNSTPDLCDLVLAMDKTVSMDYRASVHIGFRCFSDIMDASVHLQQSK